MPRYFIRLAYNGTNYKGWQLQPGMPTVQADLENAISLILRQKIEVVGCGRTDTGVHAADYYAHFNTTPAIADIADLAYKLNKLLTKDIAIKAIQPVVEEAHARFDAIERMYEYKIVRTKNPFTQNLAYFYHGELNISQMNLAAALLLGTADFNAFCKTHTDVKTTICTVSQAYWEERGDVLVFTITANRFLRNMVRAIVGTLLDVGRGKLSVNNFQDIINSKNRSEARDSAPAEGLYLADIKYPIHLFI